MRTRGRWSAIGIGILLIATIEVLSDTLLDPVLPFPLDMLLVTAVVFVVAVAASRIAFRSIDELTVTLQARNRQLETRNASARALHQVTVAVAALGDLDQILRATVDHARVLLGADAALLTVVGPDGATIVRATSGPTEAFVLDQADRRDDDQALFFRPAFRRGLLAAALQHGDNTLGTLAVGSRSERSYAVDDLETLSSLAGQAAIAIHQEHLQAQIRELAVRRERERIARDLHDGIAQVLGYVNTKSQAVERLLEVGRDAEARDQVAELAAAARSVYVDVRATIASLAALPTADEPLPGAISRLASQFADTAKVAVEVGVTETAARAPVGPAVRKEVSAIVREALTNIRKHADAVRVQIRVDADTENLIVEITDDGRGFDSTAPELPGEWPHFGRVAMADRAASLGGAIEWRTNHGEGTTVRLRVPLVAPSLPQTAHP